MTRWLVATALTVLPMLAQAECGWLLMTPPVTGERGKGTYQSHHGRPMVEWSQHSAHDSAQSCEREKSREVAQLDAMAEKITDPKIHRDLKVMVMLANMQYRCLPASQVPVR
jgi:hypothetical protein